jgi:hypothetical protein
MIMNKQPLIISISGRAGSGKDTVREMIQLFYNKRPKSLEEFKKNYNIYKENNFLGSENCVSIALADKLKRICAVMFDLDLELFYDRNSKEHKYVNLETHDLVNFSESIENKIVTASYYYNHSDEPGITKSYMSIRELMVYVGTYLINYNFDLNFFTNTVNKFINNNYDKAAIIISDVRYDTEYDFIDHKKGVKILVKNSRVTPLNNIGENIEDDHEFDFEINNDGTFDELLENVYNMLTNHIIYKNIQQCLHNVKLRLVSTDDGKSVYELLNSNFDGINYGDYAYIDEMQTVLVDKIDQLTINETILKPGRNIGGFIIDDIYKQNNRLYLTHKPIDLKYV